MSVSELLSPLVGRFVFGWFFLSQAMLYAGDWEGTIHLMSYRGIPGAAFILAVAILFLVMGSLSLIFGYHARYGALILFTITIISMVTLHDYWLIPDAASRAAEHQLFACHAAIAGGLLMLIGLGPGPFAVDNAGKGGPRKK
ncbi:MAG: DoxX family protein [Alphaproteobacteria bacterium]|nr:DoxX family protein [Alphaproteobacteria bacterium]